MSNEFTNNEIERILHAKVHLRQRFEVNVPSYWKDAPVDSLFVTGGAIASLLQLDDPKDYDFYCTDSKLIRDFAQVLENDYNDLIADIAEDYKQVFGKNGKMITGNAVTMKDKNSFITLEFEPGTSVRSTFDYVHCLPYYDIKSNKLFISKQQYDACVNKVLIVNNPKSIKPYREHKFLERGYIK